MSKFYSVHFCFLSFCWVLGFLGRFVITCQIPKFYLICCGAGVICRHFRTRWSGVRTLFLAHFSVCVTMGRWLSLLEPEFSHLYMYDTSNPILWSLFVLNEWTHVKNLEQYLVIMSGKHKLVILLSWECIIHEGMYLCLNSIFELLDKWIRSLGTGLTNLIELWENLKVKSYFSKNYINIVMLFLLICIVYFF